MSDQLAAVAAALGAPPEIVMRSAQARAKADGTTAEAVLAAWSGGEAVPAAAAPAPAAQPVPAPAAEPAVAETATPAPIATPAPAAAPEPAPAAETEPEPEPEPEPERFESEEEAAAAGAIPRWLVAAFIIIPTIAVLYALFLPNGPNCGDAGSLAVDPITGTAVNCDLTPYGVEVIDYYAIGGAEFTACAACHGENGGGAGNFPAFVGGSLLTTFPEGQCEAQVEWVSLGTTGWPDPTYGANDKPVGGSGAVMPAFGTTLTDEELRAVVLYERVRFGGQALDAALADCGLAEAGPSGE
ncbi:MAG: cytochrome c [Acidimicrobiia bacterium]|nr:cytochrome c [Acidimicrobiia bacterium]